MTQHLPSLLTGLATAPGERRRVRARWPTTSRLRRDAPPQQRAKDLLINSRYEALLDEAGLRVAEDFLSLPRTIVSGHPDRQVSHVMIGDIPAFLKIEHRVAWKDRLLNAWAGFGFASKSWREALMLAHVDERCPCGPEWIAAGETADGRAFVLIRELTGFVSLRSYLEQHPTASTKHNLARRLGGLLARLHDAGIAHVDLYSNHVLINPHTGRIVFLDWQRAIHQRLAGWAARWRDLATLTVTLPAQSASRRDRAVCLLAYLRATTPDRAVRKALRARSLARIAGLVKRLTRRGHVRAKQMSPLDAGVQQLICLDGDALCVTPAFRELWPEPVPAWLLAIEREDTNVAEMMLPNGELGRVTRACHSPSWYARFGKTWISPQRRQMNLLFRLQRHGVAVPQVLAVADRPLPGGQIASLLFVRLYPATPLSDWLHQSHDLRVRRQFLRAIGGLLARVHRAGCFFGGSFDDLAVAADRHPVLTGATRLSIRRRWRSHAMRQDLTGLERELREAGCTRTDWLRVRRAYEGSSGLSWLN